MASSTSSKKTKPEVKPDQKGKAQAAKPQAEKREEGKKSSSVHAAIAVIAALAIIAVVILYLFLPGLGGVPFQAFKSNFQSAQRVAIAVTYLNQSQYVNEVPCYSNMLEIIGRTRNASTIDFLLMNATKCEYSPTGLGPSASFITVSAGSCMEIANNEPSIFLNYSGYNYTRITADHLYLGANFAYLASCPIAAEFV